MDGGVRKRNQEGKVQMYVLTIIAITLVLLIIPYRVFAGKLEQFIIGYPYFSGELVWGKIVAFGDLRETKGLGIWGTECFAIVEWEEADMKQSACILRHEEDLEGANVLLSVDKKKGLAVRCKTGNYFLKWSQTDQVRVMGFICGIGSLSLQIFSEPRGFVLIGVILAVYFAWLPYIYAYIQSVWKKRYYYGVQRPKSAFDPEIMEEHMQNLNGKEIFAIVLFAIAILAFIILQELY